MLEEFKRENRELAIAIAQAIKDSSYTKKEIAEAMLLTETAFNNKLYEKNGTSFFNTLDLVKIAEITGSPAIAQYFASKAGDFIVIKAVDAQEMDNVDLFDLQSEIDILVGEAERFYRQAIRDGIMDPKEEEGYRKISQRIEAKRAQLKELRISLYKR